MRIIHRREAAADNPASGDGSDPELDQLVRIGSSRQVPELIGGADADFTVPGLDGVQARFPGQGTVEGDKVLAQAFENAFAAIDTSREQDPVAEA